MRALLNQWDQKLRNELGDRRLPLQAHGTVLRNGAAPQDVAEAERRLGVTLPEWYTEFLLLSDGAWASSMGAVDERRPALGFLPVTEIGRLREIDPERIAIWTDLSAGGPHELRDGVGVDVSSFEAMREALVISGGQAVDVDLLVPVDGGLWELWTVHREDIQAYGSITSLLREMLARPSDVPMPSRGDELIAAILRKGRTVLLRELVAMRDGRAQSVALEVLVSKDVFELLVAELGDEWKADRARVLPATSALAKLPTADALEPLRAAYRRACLVESELFRSEMRVAVLRARLACGDPQAPDLIRRAVDDPDRRVRRYADRAVAKLND